MHGWPWRGLGVVMAWVPGIHIHASEAQNSRAAMFSSSVPRDLCDHFQRMHLRVRGSDCRIHSCGAFPAVVQFVRELVLNCALRMPEVKLVEI